jgi:hypothetical protein
MFVAETLDSEMFRATLVVGGSPETSLRPDGVRSRLCQGMARGIKRCQLDRIGCGIVIEHTGRALVIAPAPRAVPGDQAVLVIPVPHGAVRVRSPTVICVNLLGPRAAVSAELNRSQSGAVGSGHRDPDVVVVSPRSVSDLSPGKVTVGERLS